MTCGTANAKCPEGGPSEVVPILVVSHLEADHLSLRTIFHASNWRLEGAVSCAEALALLRERCFSVVISAWDLPNGDWKLLLKALEQLPQRPRLIVSSRLADERLWAEVLSMGGYDLLLTPFRADEVLQVAYMAWHAWQRG